MIQVVHLNEAVERRLYVQMEASLFEKELFFLCEQPEEYDSFGPVVQTVLRVHLDRATEQFYSLTHPVHVLRKFCTECRRDVFIADGAF